MKIVIEFVVTGVMYDENAALFQQWLVSIKIEVITKRHHLYQQRIEDRIDVVGRDIRNPRDQDVALAANRDDVLIKTARDDLFMDQIGLSGMARCHLVLCRSRVQ